VVVEIGAGLGTLTAALAVAEPAPKRIIAVERDPEMVKVLEDELGATPGIEILSRDALSLDFASMSRAAGRPLVVVGNLPYQIGSEMLLTVSRAGAAVARAILMVQREFAQRVVAPSGSKTYGRLSVMIQQRALARILFHVPPGAFHPRPSVVSSVLRVEPRAGLLAPVRDVALFERVVKEAFGTRRKMLRRALEPAFGAPAVARALESAGIEGTLRAETLDIAAFARLSDGMSVALETTGPSG
jgi:16S rRNA (adenine1518-N6/adenine1519-N6)-dimethyltransferase